MAQNVRLIVTLRCEEPRCDAEGNDDDQADEETPPVGHGRTYMYVRIGYCVFGKERRVASLSGGDAVDRGRR